MKILIISELFPPDVRGGYELRCEEACYWLHKKGYQIEVLTTQSKHKFNNYPFPVHRKLRKYPNSKTRTEWSAWEKFYYAIIDNFSFSKVLSKTNPDLIYIWKSSEISRSLIPKIFQTPVPKLVDISSQWFHKVITQHGSIYSFLERRNGPFVKKKIKELIAKALPFISLGMLARDYKINWCGLSGYFTSNWNKSFHAGQIPECDLFSVFHTGVDLIAFPFKQKEYSSDTIRLLYVGRISVDKGFLLLLNQINYPKSKNIYLTVIGDFPSNKEKALIKSTIVKMGLEKKISFLGKIPRRVLYKYYHQADFTVFPSIWDEPFSRVPLESMSCGRPCISTDNPGSKELFDLDAPLILLERSNDSLENVLKSFTSDIDQYEKLSLSGRKFIEASFTFDHFMMNIEKTFLGGAKR